MNIQLLTCFSDDQFPKRPQHLSRCQPGQIALPSFDVQRLPHWSQHGTNVQFQIVYNAKVVLILIVIQIVLFLIKLPLYNL